jgi:uncharacterized membrane protein YkvA (DUF1232 family)
MINPFSRWLNRDRDDATSPAMDPPGLADVRPEDYVGTDTEANEKIVRAGFAPKAKKFLRRLPMASDVVAMYFCMLDSKTPWRIRGTAAAALASFILPQPARLALLQRLRASSGLRVSDEDARSRLDAIPDRLPLVGLRDEITRLASALSALAAHVTDEHRQRAREWMELENLDSPDPGATDELDHLA